MAELRDLDPKDEGRAPRHWNQRRDIRAKQLAKPQENRSHVSAATKAYLHLWPSRPDFIPSNAKQAQEPRKSEEEKFRAYLQIDFHCDMLGVMKMWLRPWLVMNRWMRPWLVRTSQPEDQRILGQKLWAFESRGLARGKDGK